MTEVSNEQLAIIAVPFEGTYIYEPNPNYRGDRIQPHIIRYSPNERVNADGTRSIGMSFPALVATDFLADADKALHGVAEILNAAPVMAAELLALRGAKDRAAIETKIAAMIKAIRDVNAIMPTAHSSQHISITNEELRIVMLNFAKSLFIEKEE